MIPFEPDDTDWCFDEALEYEREQERFDAEDNEASAGEEPDGEA